MGKTSRWFRALFGAKKSSGSPSKEKKKKKTKNWTVGRPSSGNDGGIHEDSLAVPYPEAMDANKHAIAVAAATAAVAEAALAAAQAAAEVVRLTSGGGSRLPAIAHVRGIDRRREWAAVKIQSAFRAYLARRALRALKGLVKLQALVRGHIVRKQSADMLRRMQAMARIQAKACANRSHVSQYSHSSSKVSHSYEPRYQPKPNMRDIVNLERTNLSSNWLDRWMQECTWNRHRDISPLTGHTDEEKSDKILEVDTWRPHLNSRHDRIFQMPQDIKSWNHSDQFIALDSLSRHSANSQKPNPSLSSIEALSIRSLKVPMEGAQAAAAWAVESPELYTASSRPGSSGRRGPFTPARSECSRSVFSEYLGHPNYMAYTESSRAKVRSQSAPKQRIHFERPGPTKTCVHSYWDSDTISERGSNLQVNLMSRAYPGSGRMDNRLGMSFQGGSTATAWNSSSYGGRS